MMNKYILILCGCFLFNALESTAQQKPVKGYYAIGNNSNKLATPVTASQIQVGGGSSTVQKGYYKIGNNENKLAAPLQVVSPSKKPVIQKGYYSIGNNADKLRR